MPSSVYPGTDLPTVMSSCFWPLAIIISPKPYTQIHVAKLIAAPSDSPQSDIQSSPVSFPPIFPTIISMALHISRIILLNYSLGYIHISCLCVSAHTPSSVWNAFPIHTSWGHFYPSHVQRCKPSNIYESLFIMPKKERKK